MWKLVVFVSLFTADALQVAENFTQGQRLQVHDPGASQDKKVFCCAKARPGWQHNPLYLYHGAQQLKNTLPKQPPYVVFDVHFEMNEANGQGSCAAGGMRILSPVKPESCAMRDFFVEAWTKEYPNDKFYSGGLGAAEFVGEEEEEDDVKRDEGTLAMELKKSARTEWVHSVYDFLQRYPEGAPFEAGTFRLFVEEAVRTAQACKPLPEGAAPAEQEVQKKACEERRRKDPFADLISDAETRCCARPASLLESLGEALCHRPFNHKFVWAPGGGSGGCARGAVRILTGAGRCSIKKTFQQMMPLLVNETGEFTEAPAGDNNLPMEQKKKLRQQWVHLVHRVLAQSAQIEGAQVDTTTFETLALSALGSVRCKDPSTPNDEREKTWKCDVPKDPVAVAITRVKEAAERAKAVKAHVKDNIQKRVTEWEAEQKRKAEEKEKEKEKEKEINQKHVEEEKIKEQAAAAQQNQKDGIDTIGKDQNRHDGSQTGGQ